MKRLILLFLGIALFFQLDAQEISRFEYFIDTDPGEGNATPVSFASDSVVGFSFSVDLNALDDGIHRLYMRAMDDSSRWSQVMKRNFYIEYLQDEQLSDLTKIEYFIDNDPGFGNANPVSIPPGTTGDISFTADLSALDGGIHHLLMRAKDADEKWSVITKRAFMVETLEETPPDLTDLEYFIDTDPGYGNGTAIDITPGTVQDVDFSVDLTALDQGIHRLFVRGKDSEGSWSNMSARTFLIETLGDSLPELTDLEYFFDTDPGYGNGIPVTMNSGAVQDLDITADVTSLGGGTHRLFIRGKDANGKWSMVYINDFCIGPQAQFTAYNACFGDTVQFIDETVDTTASTIYSWDVNNDGTEDYNTRGNISHYYESPGTYHPSLVVYDESSCRDTFSYEITVYPVDTTTENATICEGESYRGFTESGTHYITDTGTNGCDSITEIILTVTEPQLFTDSVEICHGDTLNWRDSLYATPGTYYDSLNTVNGCDSVYSLSLTVHSSYLFPDTSEICQGDSYIWRSSTYDSTGIYYDSLTTVNGCDSIYQLALTVQPTHLFTDSAEIYEGEVYTWRGSDYDTAATYYDSLTTVEGCDSVYRLVLDLMPADTNLVADFTITPSQGNITKTFTFDGSGSSNADYYKWDFEGDGTWDTGFEESPTTTHSYANPGIYSVTLVVKDVNEKYDTLSKPLTVEDYVIIPEDSLVLEYFFDENVALLGGNLEFFDPGSPGGILDFQAPVEHLEDGIHILYYRVRDTLGQWSQTYNRVFVKTDDDVVVPRDSVVFEYFFDEQTALLDGNTTSIDTATWDGEFMLNAPVEMLEQGIHKLYYRFRGKNGHWSQTYNRTFLKERLQTDTAPKIEYLEYHLNQDNGFGNGVSVDVSGYQGDSVDFVADITGLTDSNKIYIYARDEFNRWSYEYLDTFYVDTASAILADFTADVTAGDAPLEVHFTDASIGNITSWSWDFDGDGEEDTTAQHPVYVFNEPGEYTVRLTVSDGSNSDTETKADYINLTPTSIIDIVTDQGVKIFPNPTIEKFGVYIKNYMDVKRVEILSLEGVRTHKYTRNKLTKDLIHVDFGNQPSGIYLLKIYFENEVITRKVIKY